MKRLTALVCIAGLFSQVSCESPSPTASTDRSSVGVLSTTNHDPLVAAKARKFIEGRPRRCIATGLSSLSANLQYLTSQMFTPEDGTLDHFAAIDATTQSQWQSNAATVSPDEQLQAETAADSIWADIENNIAASEITQWRGTSLATGDRCEEVYDKCAAVCRRLPSSARKARALCWAACMTGYAGCRGAGFVRQRT